MTKLSGHKIIIRRKSLRFCLRYLGLYCQLLFGLTNVCVPLENKRWCALSAEYFILFDAKEKLTHKGDAVTDGDEEQIYHSHLPQTPQKSFFRNWQIQMWQEFVSCRPLQPCFWTAVLPLTVCHLWCALTASHCCLQRPGHGMERAILTRLPSKHCWDVKVPVNLTQRVIRQESTKSQWLQ